MTHYDVVIVGAGVAGLSAALHLKDLSEKSKTPIKFLILEAMDRVGGKLLTDSEGTDLGGAYIARSQHYVKTLCDRFGVGRYDLEDNGKAMMIYSGQAKTWDIRESLAGLVTNPKDAATAEAKPFDGYVPDFSPEVRDDALNAMRLLDRFAQSIPADNPHLAPNAEVWDKQTIAQLIASVASTRPVQVLLSLHMQAVHATDPNEVSALAALWFLKCLGGVTPMLYGEDGKFVGGAQTLPLKIAQHIGMEHFSFSSIVRRISLKGKDASSGIVVRYVTQSDGAIHFVEADRVLLAIPTPQTTRLLFQPSLPPKQLQVRQQWPMSTILKTFTYYKRPFWRDHGWSGRVLDQYGLAIDVYDDSKTGGPYCLMGLVSGRQAILWASPEKSAKDRHSALQQRYFEIFKDPEALQSIRYKEMEWAAEPYIMGGFHAVARPGTLTRFGRLHCEPVMNGRVRFASTETSTVWTGYIEGALLAGRVQAQAIAEEVFNGRGEPIPTHIPPVELTALTLPPIYAPATSKL